MSQYLLGIESAGYRGATEGALGLKLSRIGGTTAQTLGMDLRYEVHDLKALGLNQSNLGGLAQEHCG